MIIHKESHVDHAIKRDQWSYIVETFKNRTGFFIETIELPPSIGFVQNELVGPTCGDPPVFESEVTYERRGTRAWDSRMVHQIKRLTRFVRIIAGPHEETCSCVDARTSGTFSIETCQHCDGGGVIKHDCVLYTAYGVFSKDMPQAPKEPGDLAAERVALLEKIRDTSPSAPERAALERRYFDVDREIATARIFWSSHALCK